MCVLAQLQEAARLAWFSRPLLINIHARKQMSHFGVLSYKGAGHLNPLIALSRQLIDRGHDVTFFQKPEVDAQVRRAWVGVCSDRAAQVLFCS